MDTPPAPSESALSKTICEAARRAMEALERFGKPHAVIGAVALTGYGEPRGTKDVDFLVFCDSEEIKRLEPIARDLKLKRDDQWLNRNPMLRGFVVRYRYRGVPIDFLMPRDRHEAGLRRRKLSIRLGGRKVSLLKPEDYILLKAKAGRPRDFDDAIRITSHYLDEMDYRYIRSWSIRLGIFEEIQYIVATAERGEYG